MSKAKILALKHQIESGKIRTDSARILEYIIRTGPAYIPEIMQVLHLKQSTVTGRISELEDMGLLENLGADLTPFSDYKQSRFGYIGSEQKQREKRLSRHLKRRNRWLNVGIEEGWLDEGLNVVR